MGNQLYFVRHGESTANTARVISNRETDYAPLTPDGRQQAEELLNILRAQGGITTIHASPLMRARETAEIIAAGLGTNVEIADALREPYCGILEGRGDEAAWGLHARQEQEWRAGNRDYNVPGGESLRDVDKRFRPFIAKITSMTDEATGDMVIVSHGSILLNLLPLVLSNVDPGFARANPLGNCDVITASYQDNCFRCIEWCGLRLENA